MANNGGEHKMGSMDISMHRETYTGFIKLTTYSTVAIIVALVLMAFFLVRGH